MTPSKRPNSGLSRSSNSVITVMELPQRTNDRPTYRLSMIRWKQESTTPPSLVSLR